jgi:DMSO/TMAO reductase YedYZ molybdopterin-dependent catalytic subunit
VGTSYLAYIFLGLPLLPEQLGVFLLRLLPLFVFSAGIRTLGPLARPLLLIGVTVALILLLALIALLVERLVGAGRAANRSARRTSADGEEGRRPFLRRLLVASVGISALLIAWVDLRRVMLALATKEGSRLAEEITPISDFYVVSKNLASDPAVDPGTWRLTLPDGLVLSYQELLSIPWHQVESTFECISNEVGGTLISNGVWRGPRVQDILAKSTVPADAAYLLIESVDGYTESFPLARITPACILATHLDGKPLPTVHGFPARFVFPGHYGMKQPKWVSRISLSAHDQPGYWEQVGWSESAVVKTMSRIDQPLSGSTASAGTVRLAGLAFAGARRISAVELSWDRSGWHAASLEREFSPCSWRFWHLDALLAPGHYTVSVRATDGTGAAQTAVPAPSLPDGSAGLHSIVLDVT